MAVTEEYKVKLGADDAELQKFAKSSKAAGDAIGKNIQGFESLAGKVVAAQAAFKIASEAFGLIKDKIEELAAAYRVHETANRNFINAMQYSGNYTTASAKALEAYAAGLQKVTGVDKTTTLGLLAQAKAIGLTDEQTKKAIDASANLAAARGMDIGSAFNMVMGTIHGSTEGLKDMVPALRHVNVEALAGGAAFDLISKQFKGAAAEGGHTWDAYTARAKAAKEDIIADIGEVISQGLGLTAMAKSSAEFWEQIAETVERFKTSGIAALQALRIGFSSIDWAGLAAQLEIVAAVLAVAFGPALVTTLAELTVSVVAFAASWLAVPLGIALAIGAMDLLYKNFDRLPELGELFGAIFTRALLNVRMVFSQLLLSIIEGIEGLLSKMPGGEKMFGGMLEGLRTMETGLNKTVDDANDSFKALGDQIGSTWGKLDTGLTGKAIDEVKKLAVNVTGAFDTIKKAQENATDTHGNKGQKVTGPEVIGPEVLQAQRAFKQGLEVGQKALLDMAKSGKTEVQQLVAETNMQVAQLEKAAQILKTKGHGLTVGQEKAQADAISNIRAAAVAKEVELTKAAVLAGAALYNAQLDNTTAAIQHQLEDTTRALDEAQRRDFAHWQQYQDAKVAAAKKANEDISANAPLSEKIGNAATAIKQTNFGDAAKGMGAAIMGAWNAGSGQSMDELKDYAGALGDASKPAADAMGKLGDAITDTLVTTVEKFVEATDILVNVVLNGKLVTQLTSIISDFADLPTQLLQAFINLSAILQRIITSLPQVLNAFLQKLPELLQKIMAALPKAIQMIAAMLPKIAQAFADALPGLVQALAAQLPALVDGIFAAFSKIADKLPEIFGNILKAMPEIIKHFIAGLGALVAQLIDELPAIIEEIADNIGPIVEALVQGLLDALPRIIVALTNPQLWIKVGAAIVKAVINALVGAIQGILRGLMDALTGKSFHPKMPKLEMPDMSAAGARLTQAIKGSSSDLFKVEDFKTAAKNVDIGQKIAADVQQAAITIANQFGSLWGQFLNMLKAAWDWVITKLTAVFNFLKSIWGDVLAVLQPVFTFLKQVWDGVVSALQPLWGALSTIWHYAIDAMSSLWSSLSNIWAQITGAIGSISANVLSWLSNFQLPTIPTPGWLQSFIDAINKLGGGIHLSVGGSIGGKAAAAVHAAESHITAGNAAKAISSGHFAGGGTVYADQGLFVSRGTDTVPAMLTPGEFVINRHAAGRIGMPALNNLNAGNAPGGGVSVQAPISITTTQPIDDNFIRNRLVPTLLDAIKKKSQEGKFIMATSGLRSS